MNQGMILAMTLGVLGIVLLVSPDSVIDKNTKDKTMKMIYDNAMMLGLLCVGGAYYMYNPKPQLPSYEEATNSM